MPGDLEVRSRPSWPTITTTATADVYFGRGKIILWQRERIKRQTTNVINLVPKTLTMDIGSLHDERIGQLAAGH